MAIEHAFKIIDWHENLTKDEVPPQWMWAVDEELEMWFERVERKREAKYGGGSSKMSDDDDGSESVMYNELAENIRGK